ncbi:hypothetical protein [Streptomyces sp. NPDC102487]|uniref:hypothetical protein n=1 Tax=Streptomyces sp. NPDC102487 TaxID=3366182 RepID=UPI003829A478
MPFTQRTILVTRREFAVSADTAYGANHAEVGKAWTSADRAYRETHGLPEGGNAIPDNAIAFFPGDDEIVISFETEGPARLPGDDLARALAEYDRRAGREQMAYADLPRGEQQKYLLAASELISTLYAAKLPARS